MNRKARVQAWSTLVAALALPLLYIGGTAHATALSVIGILIFTASLLTCPALRFLPPGRLGGRARHRAAQPASPDAVPAER